MAEAGGARRWSRLDSDERRSQILAAARRLFAEHPYGSVSTVAIAEAAGVTRGLVHHYFGTKRELYLEAVEELVGDPAAFLAAPPAEGSRPAGRLDTWEESVDAWMDLIEANRDEWLLAVSAGETGRDAKMRAILERARDRTASQVLAVLGLDDRAQPEARSLVLAYGRFAEEVTREWLERGRLTREQARILLAGSLPLMVDKLLPEVAGRAGARRRRTSGKTHR